MTTMSVAELWIKAREIQDRVNGHEGNTTDGVAELLDQLFDLEDAVLRLPITSRADAFAKLRCAGLIFERGEMESGVDAVAFADAVAYLEQAL